MDQHELDELIKKSNDINKQAILQEIWLVFPTEAAKLEFVKLTTPSQNVAPEEVK